MATENSVHAENARFTIAREIIVSTMNSLLVALFALITSVFRTRTALQTEVFVLRHQLAVLHANAPRRLRLKRSDRLLWVLLSRFWRDWGRCLQIVQPATVVAWHRTAFAWYWTRKSRRRPGRPDVAAEIRDLIRRMSQANPLWGAPRIHGELLKLGIKVAPSTVAKYLRRQRKPPSQTWRAFLVNHAEQMASVDFFMVPTATFRVLFVFVVLSHARRRVLHFQVPAFANPFSLGQRYARAPDRGTAGPGSCVCDSSGRRTPSPIPASRCLVNPKQRRPRRRRRLACWPGYSFP